MRFSVRPDRPWGPPSLLYNGYRVFHGGKVRPGRAADHSPPSSAAVMEEYSYTSTHPLGHTRPVTGSLYLYLFKMCTVLPPPGVNPVAVNKHVVYSGVISFPRTAMQEHEK